MHRASVSQSIDVVYSLAGGSDYVEINAYNLDVFLTFDNDNRRQSFSVVILDDSLLELVVEDFTLELRFDPFALLRPSDVILRPNISTVVILDDDCKIVAITIRFTYSANHAAVVIGFLTFKDKDLVKYKKYAVSFSFTGLRGKSVSLYNYNIMEMESIYCSHLQTPVS